MGTIIVIPARYASSRFPGKPLAPLVGAGGEARSLLRRTHDVAAGLDVDDVLVATDDARVADHAREFGAKVAMTSGAHVNGTERCAEVAAGLRTAPDVVVNLQGDAPLTPPHFLTALVEGRAGADVATPVLVADADAVMNLRADRAAGRVGATTAVTATDGAALYFSKEVLPFGAQTVLHHVGVYAYTPQALERYASLPMGPLERAEGLEQLRFLENGMAVRCVTVEADGRPFWEVNNPEDVPRVEAALRSLGIA